MAAAPKPGIIPLRPITLGEIFDGAFRAIRTNPGSMMGMSAIVLSIVTLISVLLQGSWLASANIFQTSTTAVNDSTSGAQIAALFGSTLSSALLTAVATLFINTMLVFAVSAAVLGQRLSPGALWARVRPRLLAMIGLSLLLDLILGVVSVLPVLPGVVLGLATQSAPAGVIVGLLGLLVGVLGAIVLAIRFSLAGPALLLEGQRIVPALRRSWNLVAGSFWRVLGITLLVIVIVGIGSTALEFPFSVIGTVIMMGTIGSGDPTATTLILQLIVTGIGRVISGAVFYPFSAAVTTLLYVDLRMRREGLDVELLRAASEPGQRA